MRRLWARLAVSLLTAAVAGCGASGLASPVALRQHASVICKHTSRTISGTPTITSPKQLTAFLTRGIRGLETELSHLRGLRAGSGDVGAVYAAALRALSAQVGVLHAAVVAIARGEDPALSFKVLAPQLATLQKQADSAWTALQIPACLER